MTDQEKRWKRLIIRWTAPKGFVAMVIFLVSAFLLEYFIVYSFLSRGLADKFTWMETFQVPYVNWSFTLAVSPLLHFLPVTVVVVLISSWVFLTRHIAFVPRRMESTKKPAIKRRQPKRRRFRVIGNFFKRVNRSIQEMKNTLKKAVFRIPGFSKLSQRLFFGRTAVRSAMMIFLVFVTFALLAYSLAYPWWVHDAIVNFYHGNPSFMSLVIGTQKGFHSLGEISAPLTNALLTAAPGFRSSLQSIGASAESIAKLDITGKYLLVQNLAAWVCASVALAYGRFASTRRYKTR